MATQTLYRKANTSRAEATASLYSRFPNADLVSFVKKAATADEAAAAGATEGEQVFAATIRVADFPPADDAGDAGSEAPKEEKAEKPEESKGDEGSDEAPDFGGEGGEGGEEVEQLSGEDLTNDLLQKILDALSGGAGPMGPDAGLGAGGPGDLDLPDVGAPPAGGGMPGAGGPPLPPPIREKSPVGGGAFAHYDRNAREFSTIRAEASTIGNKAIIEEAALVYPTHKVAKIQRTGSATINGKRYKLAENGIAVVTLTAK